MAKYKRGRCRRKVRCSVCTTHRWLGNAKGRLPARDELEMRRPLEEEDEISRRKPS